MRMNHALLVLVVAGAVATAASANPTILEYGVNAVIEASPVDDVLSDGPRDVGVVYDSQAFEGNVETPETGPGGAITEDYVSIISSPSTLEVFKFVGGVEVAETSFSSSSWT